MPAGGGGEGPVVCCVGPVVVVGGGGVWGGGETQTWWAMRPPTYDIWLGACSWHDVSLVGGGLVCWSWASGLPAGK